MSLRSWTAGIIGLLALLAWAPSASADIPASLKSSCTLQNPHPGYSYYFCDDGLPPAGIGGTLANESGTNAVEVPAKYDGYVGLPAKAADATSVPGADTDGNIALDVDISYPTTAAPPGGYPVIVAMHGCCNGSKTDGESTTFDAPADRWHYNNAWGASRGYVVITYTSRGFSKGQNAASQGSTGVTELDSRYYEINDFQYLTGLVAEDSFFNVNPQKIVATGGSYGGGFSWLAVTDPIWNSPRPTNPIPMKLAAAAPKYGWTDLLYSLNPNGKQSQSPNNLPATDGSTSQSPYGFPKKSILAGLYLSGAPQAGSHATWPSWLDEGYICLTSTDPFETNPLCDDTINVSGPSFINDRSAYYQNAWFDKINPSSGSYDPNYIVPIFCACTFTDPLFTAVESVRFANRLRSLNPSYPIQQYYGDYLHFVQNKNKEWADICGSNRHVCTVADYTGGNVDTVPSMLRHEGTNTRLNRFIDHYTNPSADPNERTPSFNVAGSTQICPQNASMSQPADEPGRTYVANAYHLDSGQALANTTRSLNLNAIQTTTTNDVNPNPHADQADPILNAYAGNGGKCPFNSTPAGSGIAVYESGALSTPLTMLGPTKITITYNATDASGLQLNTRLYDVFPSGTEVMVDHGPQRVTSTSGTVAYELQGNGWRFEVGHKLRVEIAQDDEGSFKASVVSSSSNVTAVSLDVPEQIATTDSDSDGSSNQNEAFIGTDPYHACPDSNQYVDYQETPGDNARPADTNNDGRVRIGDILAVVQKFGTYRLRYDFDASGQITVADILWTVHNFAVGDC